MVSEESNRELPFQFAALNTFLFAPLTLVHMENKPTMKVENRKCKFTEGIQSSQQKSGKTALEVSRVEANFGMD